MNKLFKLLSLIWESFQIPIITKEDISLLSLTTSTLMTTESFIQIKITNEIQH